MSNNTEYFGVVRWCEEDIKNALEVQGYPVTENNIAKLRSICENHSFTDYMIEQGWEYMYDSISNGDGWDEYVAEDVIEYECNICGEVIEDDEESLWGHIQMEHEDVFEECQDWETPYMIEEFYSKI